MEEIQYDRFGFLGMPTTLPDRIPAKPAADVARILDHAKVPNVLWGWLAVGLVGLDHRFPQVDFVVPDDKIEAAKEALIAGGFTLCIDQDCAEQKEDRVAPDSVDLHGPLGLNEMNTLGARNRFHPIADIHFHLEPSKYEYYNVLSLFIQSKTLWSGWWPDLVLTDACTDAKCPDTERFPADHPHFMLSSDIDLYKCEDGSGPWAEELYAVKTLKPSLLVEALIYLFCRDWGHIKSVDEGWQDMILLGLVRVKRDDQARFIEKDLNPVLQPLWNNLNCRTRKPEGVNKWDIIREFRQSLIDNNRMPPLPPIDLTYR
ncbi:uncharacterized protein DSM5745_09609 [Aspergillus mulundensis]|uniref:Uncharacterized protein n=1 Tax=Aspergillus mulundensis TaxID=1810919 RepID=A0A3D8QW18_9EURO|nr:hypothetical protein DSM5745_09609 [Aspergillus mulundensis]RDW65870.1 hypothetical protein DSM5745_09609 [Aspergillus mulundensis]